MSNIVTENSAFHNTHTVYLLYMILDTARGSPERLGRTEEEGVGNIKRLTTGNPES